MTPTLPSQESSPISSRRFKSLRAIGALIIREMSTSYGRSPGGYFWAVMEPVAGIALLSLVFSLAVRSPALGTNFPMFYATGFLPFIFYRELEAKMTSALRFSRSLLAYPGVTYADAMIARFVLTIMTQMMVFYLVITLIVTIWDTRTAIDPMLVLSSMGGAAILGAGVGSMNCFLASIMPLYQRFWVVLSRPLVIISGVIFLHDKVPQPWRDYLWWNPLIHIVGQMRRAFYPQYQGEYVNMLYPMGLGLGLLVVALILLNRFNRDILNLF